MKKICGLCILLTLLITGCSALLKFGGLQLFDLKTRHTIQGQEMLNRLEEAKVILVGEHHTDPFHHQAELAVIEALHRSNRKIVIGLEMFQQGNQSQLTRWVDGQLNEEQFQPIYLENWNFDWSLYRPIFLYARRNHIPMVGLNIPNEISRQVAYHGFDSLSPEQKGPLKDLTCTVTPEYRDYIRQAYDDHAHGHMNFNHFCQAQLLWDTAMAMNAAQYLKKNPDTSMIILAGSGHAQKQGIPAQLKKIAPWPSLVILPETPGLYDANQLSASEADYLLLR